MATKNPFDYTEMMKAFDPEEVAKMFDPSRMFSVFESAKGASAFDMTKLFDSNRKNFEAMVEANKAAAAAYNDLFEKQMEVFGELTSVAQEQMSWMEDSASPEAMKKKTEAYAAAVEKALGLMRQLAENAKNANEEAFAAMKEQVSEAMDELRKTTGK